MESPTNNIAPDSKKVIEAEEEYLHLSKDKAGMAISGGGIRSASFGLGVMQALVVKDKLRKMDYMSTVSGGGFLGSALTWALKQGGKNAGTSPDNFPLGKQGVAGRLKEKGNQLLDFIRQHGDYLMPTSSLGSISFVAVVLRSMILSLFVYASFLTVIMIILLWLGLFEPSDRINFFGIFLPIAVKSQFILYGFALLGIYLILSFIYSLRTGLPSGKGPLHKYLSFIRGQKFIGYIWEVSLVFLLIGTLPYITGWTKSLVTHVASGSTLFGSLVGIWQYMKAQKSDKSSGPLSDIVIYLGAFALIYGLLLLTYILAQDYFFPEGKISWMYFVVLVGASALFGIVTNLNLIGPHRLWRDRLMEAFMPNKKAVDDDEWQPASESDGALMEDMCDAENPRPYHIINTNIILVDSNQTKFKNRGGDNFILSRLYCGSDATGWTTTNTFQKKIGRGITLATAMATSSAALNPNAGVSGEGATRNSIVSILLSMLNLRLGYWTTNPAKDSFPFPPNFFFPGLSSEITRSGLSENRTDIQLSDGGHFENLALYELVRRKLKLIVLSDGGADPKFNFDDLANVVEKVRVDFNAKIVFSDDYGLSNLLPRSAVKSQFTKKYGIAKNGFAIANIYYHDKTVGKLIYIKLTMVNDLPTDVYSYKGVYPDFPHQSTADQFFDEKQFEAYRELGYYITKQMMESEGKQLLQ